jgi:hypothetical protein
MPIREHWHVTRSWEDQDGLDVSPPLNRASQARLLWRLMQEAGGEYRDRRATDERLIPPLDRLARAPRLDA